MRTYSLYNNASPSGSEEPIVMALTTKKHGHDQMAGGVDAITMLLKRKNHDSVAMVMGGLFCFVKLKLGYARGHDKIDISQSRYQPKLISPRGETIKGIRYVIAVTTSYSPMHNC
jgi:hypothetical protein